MIPDEFDDLIRWESILIYYDNLTEKLLDNILIINEFMCWFQLNDFT